MIFPILQIIYTKVSPELSPWGKSDWHSVFYPINRLTRRELNELESRIYKPQLETFQQKLTVFFHPFNGKECLVIWQIKQLPDAKDKHGRGIFMGQGFIFPPELWVRTISCIDCLSLLEGEVFKDREDAMESKRVDLNTGNIEPILISEEHLQNLPINLPELTEFQHRIVCLLLRWSNNTPFPIVIKGSPEEVSIFLDRLLRYFPNPIKSKIGWDSAFDKGALSQYPIKIVGFSEKMPQPYGINWLTIDLASESLVCDTEQKRYFEPETPFQVWFTRCEDRVMSREHLGNAYLLSKAILDGGQALEIIGDEWGCFCSANHDTIERQFNLRSRQILGDIFSNYLCQSITIDKILALIAQDIPLSPLTTELEKLLLDKKLSRNELKDDFPSALIEHGSPRLQLIGRVWNKEALTVDDITLDNNTERHELISYWLDVLDPQPWLLELLKADKNLFKAATGIPVWQKYIESVCFDNRAKEILGDIFGNYLCQNIPFDKKLNLIEDDIPQSCLATELERILLDKKLSRNELKDDFPSAAIEHGSPCLQLIGRVWNKEALTVDDITLDNNTERHELISYWFDVLDPQPWLLELLKADKNLFKAATGIPVWQKYIESVCFDNRAKEILGDIFGNYLCQNIPFYKKLNLIDDDIPQSCLATELERILLDKKLSRNELKDDFPSAAIEHGSPCLQLIGRVWNKEALTVDDIKLKNNTERHVLILYWLDVLETQPWLLELLKSDKKLLNAAVGKPVWKQCIESICFDNRVNEILGYIFGNYLCQKIPFDKKLTLIEKQIPLSGLATEIERLLLDGKLSRKELKDDFPSALIEHGSPRLQLMGRVWNKETLTVDDIKLKNNTERHGLISYWLDVLGPQPWLLELIKSDENLFNAIMQLPACHKYIESVCFDNIANHPQFHKLKSFVGKIKGSSISYVKFQVFRGEIDPMSLINSVIESVELSKADFKTLLAWSRDKTPPSESSFPFVKAFLYPHYSKPMTLPCDPLARTKLLNILIKFHGFQPDSLQSYGFHEDEIAKHIKPKINLFLRLKKLIFPTKYGMSATQAVKDKNNDMET